MRNNRRVFLVFLIMILAAIQAAAGEAAAAKTEYEVLIDDQSGILDEVQKESLRLVMEPITAFCNVAFLTTDETDITTEAYSQKFEDAHWIGQPQISVLFDMGNREVVFNPDPSIQKTITHDVSNRIMDETLVHVSKGEYYLGARDNFIYIHALLEGKTIQEGTAMITELDRSLRQSRCETAENGMQILIDDFADLLTVQEKDQLLEVMHPITAYGNVAFVSVADTDKTTQEYAGDYVYDHWHNTNATMLLIDMQNRYIRIESDGAIGNIVDEDYGDTITDNIYRFASEQDYFGCAKEAYSEILSLLEGQRIAQPMKYISNALLALIASVVCMFFVVSILIRKKAPAMEELTGFVAHTVSITSMTRRRRYPSLSGSTGSGSVSSSTPGRYFSGSSGSSGYSGSSSGSSGYSGSSSGSSGYSGSSSGSSSHSGGSSRSAGSSGSHTSRGGQHRF